MDINELAQRHEDDHPGYVLTDWYEAGFPSYEIYLRVLMQVEQPLPAIDQFVLRALEAKVVAVNEISGIFGLEHSITYDALERLQREGYVTILRTLEGNGQRETLGITKKGREILQTMIFLRPEEESFPFCLDALTGEYYPHRRLFTPKNAKNADLYQFPTALAVPEYDEIEIINLKRVWREVRRSLATAYQSKELLEIITREKWFLGYRIMRVLQFVNRDDGAIIVHVYDGVDRSPRHEVALLKMEDEGIRALRAEKKRGPEALEDPIVEVVAPDLYEAAKKKAVEIPKLEQDIARIERQIEETKELKRASVDVDDKRQVERQQNDLRSEIDRLNQQIKLLENAAPTIRILSMTEHRPMLLQALKEAKKRVLIVSPWLNPTAVNRELRELIAQAVARGVEVWIGYGFGESDYREKQTLRMLEEMQQKVKGGKRLRLCRLEDTHAKVVICDESYMITTSFNWLSFAGDPERGNRVEIGTLTREPKAVRAMLDRLMPMFEAIPN